MILNAAANRQHIQLDHLTLSTPDNTEYNAEDSFDRSSITVTAHYTNGALRVIADYSTDPPAGIPDGTSAIVFSFTEFGVTAAAQLPVTVYHRVKSLDVSLPAKLSYERRDALDTTGMVIVAVYSDGVRTVLPVGAFTVSPTELMTEGTQQITVSYAERGVSVTAQFAVEVGPFDPHVANWTEWEAKYPNWDVIETEGVTWNGLEGT